MSDTFSVHKSVDTFKMFAMTTVASLLAIQFPPTIAPRLEQPSTQLAASSYVINQTNEAEKQGNKSMLILATAVAGSIAAGLALRKRDTHQGSTKYTSSHGEQQTSIIRLDQANRKLQRKLLTLLHDDKEAAKRLLTQAKLKYPNKTVDWCVEKVIYDLERDRGGL